MLTTQQLQQLKTFALADATAAGYIAAGNDSELTAWFNANASPDFWVYRKGILSGEIGKIVSYVAVAAMTTGNLDRVNNFLNLNSETFDGRDDVKTFLMDTFSGALGGQGQATRDALDAMLRKLANRFERALAIGSGAQATPGTLTVEGTIDTTIASQIRTA